MQLASTIIAPTDRSMPPEITTSAWAIARKASGSVAAVMVRTSNPPNSGTWLTRQANSTIRSSATPASQPCRRRSRVSRLLGGGRAVTPPVDVATVIGALLSCRHLQAVHRTEQRALRRVGGPLGDHPAAVQ